MGQGTSVTIRLPRIRPEAAEAELAA